MTWDTVALGAGGIVVSLLTFWLGYRQTIGAKQERIQRTNEEIEAIVLKRILLEEMAPSFEDLARLIAGKAIAVRLNRADIRKPADLATLLWTRVVENDLISPDRRKEILSQAFPIKEPAPEMALTVGGELPVKEPVVGFRRDRLIIWLTLIAAGLGTAVAAIPTFQQEGLGIGGLIGFFGIALVVLALPVIILSYRGGVTARPQNQHDLDTLTTYPDRDDGMRALKVLGQLSPLAISTFTRLAGDQEFCLKEGLEPGLFAKPGGAPWYRELLDAELMEEHRPPRGVEAKGRDFYILTERGKEIARLVQSRAAVPDWLKDGRTDEATEDALSGSQQADGVSDDVQ